MSQPINDQPMKLQAIYNQETIQQNKNKRVCSFKVKPLAPTFTSFSFILEGYFIINLLIYDSLLDTYCKFIESTVILIVRLL